MHERKDVALRAEAVGLALDALLQMARLIVERRDDLRVDEPTEPNELMDERAHRRRVADDVLDEPGFQDYVLRPDHVAKLRKRLGALKPDEIYIPEPYPFLGGSEEPATYSRGNVWVFLDIVAQMLGVCENGNAQGE